MRGLKSGDSDLRFEVLRLGVGVWGLGFEVLGMGVREFEGLGVWSLGLGI